MEVIPRVIVKNFSYLGIEKISEKVGLDLFFHTSIQEDNIVEIATYKLIFKGILVQEPNTFSPTLIEPGSNIKFKRKPWRNYCRWHNGPLDREDDPLTRRYCTRELHREKGLGYCKFHENTIRALYDYCLSGLGGKGLTICQQLDHMLKGKVKFAIYVIDYGGSKVKVGVTRAFRVLHRLAEQPHIVGKVIHYTNSAYKARSMEYTLSHKLSYLTERPGDRSLISPLRINIKVAINRLKKVLNNTRNIIGEGLSEPMIRILPSDMELLEKAREVDFEKISTYDEVMELIDYWGGFLILSSRSGMRAVKVNAILHGLNMIIKN